MIFNEYSHPPAIRWELNWVWSYRSPGRSGYWGIRWFWRYPWTQHSAVSPLGSRNTRFCPNPFPFTPIEISRFSAYPNCGWWQEAQATSLFPDSTGSQNNSRPGSFFSGVVGLSSGALAYSGNAAILPGSSLLRWAFVFSFGSPEQASICEANMHRRMMILIFIPKLIIRVKRQSYFGLNINVNNIKYPIIFKYDPDHVWRNRLSGAYGRWFRCVWYTSVSSQKMALSWAQGFHYLHPEHRYLSIYWCKWWVGFQFP